MLAGVILLAACESDRTVIRYNPFLANVPGAETKTKPVGQRYKDYEDPTKVEGDKIVVENPDGSVTLVSKSIRHMMSHVALCLQYEDYDLLFEQVISEQTKEQFRGEGKDPREAVQFLAKNKDDVMALFGRMPFGEQSPNIILKQPARRTALLEVTGLAAKDLHFTELWAVMEKGDWKFLWVR